MKSGESRSTTSYRELYGDLFRNNYIVMQYNFVQFLTEHLADVSRIFGADLQSVLILGVVGQMELSRRIQASERAEGINASSVGEVTGIPRETVRRKLEGLAQRGWLERDKRGLWRVVVGPDGSSARHDLTELDQRGMKRISRFLGLMHALAIEHGQKSGERPPLEPSAAGPLFGSGPLLKLGAHSIDATKPASPHAA